MMPITTSSSARRRFGEFLADLRADELDALQSLGWPFAAASGAMTITLAHAARWFWSALPSGRRISTSREEPKFCTEIVSHGRRSPPSVADLVEIGGLAGS